MERHIARHDQSTGGSGAWFQRGSPPFRLELALIRYGAPGQAGPARLIPGRSSAMRMPAFPPRIAILARRASGSNSHVYIGKRLVISDARVGQMIAIAFRNMEAKRW